jgi:glycerol-3-phosphate acyltransferase PlsX
MVSGGNTGACVLACAKHFQLLRGVRRAGLAAVYPRHVEYPGQDRFALLLDVGATVRCEADELVQFALMGAAYAASIARNARPRVALVGGGEAGAVPLEVERAGDLLLRQTRLNYVGAIEPLDVPRGIADVVVTSGFVGHAVVSLLEGAPDTVLSFARYAYKDKLLWRAALGMLSGGLGRIKRLTDWQEYGGAPLLGYEHVLLRAHSASGEHAIANAIKVCAKTVQKGLAGDIGARVGELAARAQDRAIPG